MRKQVLIASLGVAMLLVASVADAADLLKRQVSPPAAGGNVPSALLADMGLEQMEVLSDQQGAEVRGNGFFFFLVGFHHHFHPFFFHHHHHPFFFHHHHGHHGHVHFPHVW